MIDLLDKSYAQQRVEKGSLLFSEGAMCSAVPFLKEGLLKVYLISESGRELTLYMAVRWFEENRLWRSIFMKVLSENLFTLMFTINSMVSESVKDRMVKYLLSNYGGCNPIERTHEDIAKDVGSVRVVVSRVLKELEREGLISLRRGKIFIKDYESLKRRAEDTRL
ncbi:MAG: Crp/Fnr family transcriptional regulator [Aquificaceae bacterium]